MLEIQDNNNISGSAFKNQQVNESTAERQVGGSINKLFTSNYYDYKMCCFKRAMSVPKRLIDSKAWNYCHHNGNTRMKYEE